MWYMDTHTEDDTDEDMGCGIWICIRRTMLMRICYF